MSDHFEAVIQIKDAVIAGDLGGVRTPAGALTHPVAGSPDTWAPFIAANVRLAGDVLVAEDLSAAAQAAARLANTCGDCHVAVEGGPHFAAPVAPWRARAHDIERHMVRHQWAADRMWEGLVAHDDARWRVGAEIFASDRPLRRRDYVVHGDAVDGSVGLDRDAREIGRRATTTVAWPARADIYGELLATCAGCHKRWL